MDAVVDAYFPFLEVLGERLEALEQELMDTPRQTHVAQIHAMRRDMLTVRRVVWPMRELLNGLLRAEHPVGKAGARVLVSECFDHTVTPLELADTNTEIQRRLTYNQTEDATNTN